tara:strand:- start:598 stop:990 length:393 start_codon:yes stop_codon:yes gene_type:complete
MDKASNKKKRQVLKGASAQPLKDGKYIASFDDVFDVILKKLKSEMGKRFKRNAKDGLGFVNSIAKLVRMKVTDKNQSKGKLFLTLSEIDEDMGTVTGPHIAGTGDDSSVVVVRKKKKKSAKDLYNYIKKR